MGAAPNLLAVRITRFEAGRRLLREVFLPMPRNGKNLRLVWKGDEMRPELLQKLIADEVETLYVTFEEGEARDPERILLYEREVEEVAPREAANHAELQAVVSTDRTSEEETRVAPAEAASTESASVAAGPEVEEQTKVGAADQEALATSRVSGGNEELEPAAKGGPADAEGELRLKSDAAAESAAPLSADGSVERGPENSSTLGAEPEGSGRATTTVTNEELESNVSVLKLHEGSARIRGAAEDDGQAAADSARRAAQRERDEAAEEARRAFTVAAISDELADIAQRIKGAPDHVVNKLRQDAQGLAVAMREVIALGYIPKEVAERFDVQHEVENLKQDLDDGKTPAAEVLEAVHRKAEADAAAAAEATREVEKEADRDGRRDLSRADEIREMPLIASRFAAYLGYSLGYVDVTFLSELSTATAMHFEGTDLHPQAGRELPKLTGLFVQEGSGSGNEAVSDTADIIQFLEAYFRNPSCDRTYPELTQKTFAATVEQLHSSDAAPDGVRLARWRRFVEKGPSFDAHSVCSKAVSRAQKEARRYRGHEHAKPFR